METIWNRWYGFDSVFPETLMEFTSLIFDNLILFKAVNKTVVLSLCDSPIIPMKRHRSSTQTASTVTSGAAAPEPTNATKTAKNERMSDLSGYRWV